MEGLTPWIAAACALAAAALCAALLLERWRMRALAEKMEEFLTSGGKPLDFSVREDSLAPLHNAAAELENRVTLGKEHLSAECRRTSALTADISHQLKTPLASLKLFCELDAGAHLEEELAQIERMEKLIGALLRLERLCADGYEFRFAPCEMADVIRAAWASVEPVYPGRRLEIEGSAALRCDEKWMGEAFVNLLRNACEHMEPGGAVRVRLEQTDTSLFCTLEDEGGGVSPRDLPHLFERFYRAQGRQTQGVGIGLAIVREIVRRHHGAVRAENTGRGLRIRIDMPRLENAA